MRLTIEVSECTGCPFYFEHSIVKEEPGGEPNKHYFYGGFCGEVESEVAHRKLNGGLIRNRMIGEWSNPEDKENVTAKIPDWCPHREKS